jgi:hypothetical protein
MAEKAAGLIAGLRLECDRLQNAPGRPGQGEKLAAHTQKNDGYFEREEHACGYQELKKADNNAAADTFVAATDYQKAKQS